MGRALAFFFALLVLVAVIPGCSEGEEAPVEVGSVVIGVTSELRVGVDIHRLHVQMWVGDQQIKDVELTVASSDSPLTLPAEFPFLDVAAGAIVKVKLDAFGSGDSKTPLVTRLAATRVVINKKLLLHVHLDARCVIAFGSTAPTCVEPETCISGTCKDVMIDPKSLPAYAASWSMVMNDICKPAEGGAPSVTVGQGQADYLPMTDLEEAQVEAGPQGGHHIWVAIRIKNLLQSGSLTRVTGHFPDLNLDVKPMQLIFTFDQDEGGYCKLYGLRYQLDQDQPIDGFLGKVLKVTVQVTDKEGSVGVGERMVTLSQDIL
jgi:hypothetical protein